MGTNYFTSRLTEVVNNCVKEVVITEVLVVINYLILTMLLLLLLLLISVLTIMRQSGVSKL